HTVRFILSSANAPFLVNLTDPSASVLSAEYAAQLLKAGKASEINWKPVGTGPFIFQKYVKDATIRFKGNPEYWKPNDVQLSHLIFTITPDAAVRVQKFKANECQVMSYPRSVDIAGLEADPNLQVFSQPGFNMGYLAYNVTHKPLNDVRVRRALDMAINKKAMIDAVYEGHAQIAIAPMPPLQWSYDKTLQDAPRDLEQAKKLLARAGYPNGFTLSLWATPVERPYNPNPRLMAQMIQADWEKIGLTAKIVFYEWGEYLKRAFDGEHDTILIGGLAYNGDPDNWLGNLSCRNLKSFNLSKWCYEPFEILIRQAVQTTDIAQRTALYLKAQQIFKREQPFTPIAYPAVYQPIRRNVTGFRINPLGTTRFSSVGLSHD
ncbi:ABC transporter substrate-binding protein, partial [Candidatus Glomeribacter gigasporarum]|uniref:ABC transporter substrate-binding protein n=1 Tax=Candidatus Glomeribacter gigasporarum TaxID=132144 RepID=UPI0005B26D17